MKTKSGLKCQHCDTRIRSTNYRDFQRHEELCETYKDYIRKESDSFHCLICDRLFKEQPKIFLHLSLKHFKTFSRIHFKKCWTCHQRYSRQSKHLLLCSKYNSYIEHLSGGKWKCIKNNCCNGKTFETQVGVFRHCSKKDESRIRVRYEESVLGAEDVVSNGNIDDSRSDSDESFHVFICSDKTRSVNDVPKSPANENFDSDDSVQIIEDEESTQNLENPNDKVELSAKDPKSIQENDGDEGVEGFKSNGFIGAVFNLFVCDFCSTYFPSQAFAISHLKKYHKVPNSFHKYMKRKHV